MKRVLWAIGGLLVLLVAAVLIGLGLVDWNQYKGDIQNQARDATGRELIINGDISITVFPAPALIANDVLLANIEGAASKNMLRLKYLEVRIALMPLLASRIEVERIKLVDPEIELEVLADGRKNWVFDTDGPGTASQTIPGAPSGEEKGPAAADISTSALPCSISTSPSANEVGSVPRSADPNLLRSVLSARSNADGPALQAKSEIAPNISPADRSI